MIRELIYFLAQQSASPAPAPAAPASAPSGATGQGDLMSNLTLPLMMVAIFAAMWFLMIRPQRKEEKRKKEMLSSLKKGDSVVTTSGIIGTVANVKDDTVLLKVGDNTKMEFVKSAITALRSGGRSESSSKD